jgi:hypothetical protein
MSTPPLNTLIVTFSVHEGDNEDSRWRAAGVRSSLKLMMRIHEAVELSTGRYVVKTTMTAEGLFDSLQILIDKSQDNLEVIWMN